MANVQQNLSGFHKSWLFWSEDTCTHGRMQRLFWCSTWKTLPPSCNPWQISPSPVFHSPWHKCLHLGSSWGCGRSCSPLASTWSQCKPVDPSGTPWDSRGSKVAFKLSKSNLATSNACSCIPVQSLTHCCSSKQQVITPEQFCQSLIFAAIKIYFHPETAKK